MKQLICTILLLGCMHLTALTQEQEPPPTTDSATLTTITTTDFMESISGGKLNWLHTYTTQNGARGWCLLGKCRIPGDTEGLWIEWCCKLGE